MNKIISIIKNIFLVLVLISSFVGLIAYMLQDKWIDTNLHPILMPFVIIMVIMVSINMVRWLWNGKIE